MSDEEKLFLANLPATRYALDVLAEKFPTNKYIKAICKKYLYEIDHQDELDYYFDVVTAKQIMNIMKLINFATGSVAGKSLYEGSVDYQFFLVLNMFCWKRKDKPEKRRYEVVLLWIARKNSKSCNAGLIMVILMLLEPKYSEFYLCSNTRDQAKIVYNETKKLIEVSPALAGRFKTRRDYIECLLNKNILKPLSSDYNTTDGLRVSAACIDEVGAAKDGGLIESMTSGMLSVSNRLLILISTSYANTQNPFLEWTEYSKKVIDGIVEDEKLFAMLYSLDDGDEMVVDNFMKANPLQAVLEDGKEYLESEYKKALEMGGDKLTSFKCKHLNIWLDGGVNEIYIDTNMLKQCSAPRGGINWRGHRVYGGLDLAMTTDNCSFTILANINGRVCSKTWAFIPAGKIEEKSRIEKINYRQMIEKGDCIACGDAVVDYGFIEDFIANLRTELGIEYIAIGYDRYNCMSTAQRLEREFHIPMIEVKQHSSVLHVPTKRLEELVLIGDFAYEQNQLYERNFSNARCTYDTNLNRYVTKKKSTGKVDMVFSTLDALCLYCADSLVDDFVVQVV